METITCNHLEAMMVMLNDLKKTIVYNKHTGMWGWGNCYYFEDDGEGVVPIEFRFPSFLSALEDVVEPYMSDKE